MTSGQDWLARSSAFKVDNRPVIGGIRVSSQSAAVVECVSPATGEVLHELPVGSVADVESAVNGARSSFESGAWSELSPFVRKLLLMRLADAIDRNCEDLALCDSLEMGKPITLALGDAAAAGHIFRYYAEFADKVYSSAAVCGPHLTQYGRREPRGVIAAIVAWNYPLPNAAMKLAPALAAGNSVVLKPSELSPSSALRLAELALEAGIPPGVLNVVPGQGSTVGAALAAHAGVDFIAFTGSSATGRRLMSLAAEGLKPLQLECGGKSPTIVFADCKDLAVVADDAAKRIFDNQGQLCVAGTRLVTHKSIKEQLVTLIIDRAKSYRVGHPLDPATTYGPLASRSRMESVLGHVRAGVSGGATLRFGGRRPPDQKDGFFVEPTVFDEVTPNMRLAQDDIFGPVLSVMSFETVDDAIAIANGTPYGLSATAWTRDTEVATEVIRRLKVGRVSVLSSPPNPAAIAFPLSAEPFGQSGFGFEAGREGLEVYTRLKAVELHA